MNLKNIPRDKLLHFIAGAGVALVSQVALWALMRSFMPGLGTVSAFIVGHFKEVYDGKVNAQRARDGLPPKHTVEVADRNATWMGGIVVDALMTGGSMLLF